MQYMPYTPYMLDDENVISETLCDRDLSLFSNTLSDFSNVYAIDQNSAYALNSANAVNANSINSVNASNASNCFLDSNQEKVTSSFTNRRKKQLRDKINKLSQTEHEEIFKILKQKQIGFTQNKNGVFFDISLLDESAAIEVEQFVDFCISNKVELDEYDKQINECKMSNCFDRMKVSTPLTNVIAANVVIDDWQGLITETRTNEKISAFVSLLENFSEKLSIKRTNTKFINAKKRYSKKTISDKKNELDLQNNLDEEVYACDIKIYTL